MKDTCIVFDSSADCKNQEFDDVFVLPTTIISNKNGKVTTYKDGVDITIEEVEKNENEGHFYSTAAVNPSLALELFTKLSKDYKMVYVFPIPGTISPGGVNSLNLAASEFDNVIIVEQSMVSLMSRWEILDLLELKKNNLLDLPHIKEVVNYYAQNIAAALVTRDLSFLINGGRIKKVTGMIAKLLNIIPINSFDREGVTQRLKVMKIDKIPNAIEKYFSTFLNDFKWENVERVGLLSSKLQSPKFKIKEIENLIKNTFAKKLPKGIVFETGGLPAVIACHTGPNYIAFLVLMKKEKI